MNFESCALLCESFLLDYVGVLNFLLVCTFLVFSVDHKVQEVFSKRRQILVSRIAYVRSFNCNLKQSFCTLAGFRT